MVYVIVLFGSLIGISIVIGLRIIMQNNKMRRFVNGFQAQEKDADVLEEESEIDKRSSMPRISSKDHKEILSLSRRAEKSQAQDKGDEAEKLLIQALTVVPDNIDILSQLAKLYLETDRFSKAEALYKELLLRKKDVSFYANLGLAFFKQNEFEEAIRAYSEALKRDPKNADRQASLARASIAIGLYSDATPLLEKATAVLSRNTELLRLLAECYIHENQHQNAESTYRKINKLEPYDEEVKEKLLAFAGV